jgi:HSP20 family protein
MSRTGFLRHGISIPLVALQDELNRVLSHYRHFGPVGSEPAEPTEIEPSAWTPALDLTETPEEIRLWIDLPGVDPNTVELTVTGPQLSLRGDRRAPEVEDGRRHSAERVYGPFFRQVALPSEVDVDAVEAQSRNGVLEIRLPKAQAVRPRTIPVKPS